MWHGRVFCKPHEGFGDRIRVIAFAQLLANELKLPLSVAWDNDATCGVELSTWLDTEFELLPGDHPRPDRQCVVVDCHGSLVSTRNPLECWYVLPKLFKRKRKLQLDLTGMVALHYRSTDILFHEKSRVVDFDMFVAKAVEMYPGRALVLLTDDPENRKLVKKHKEIKEVYAPKIAERDAEGSEEATMRDWMAITTADGVVGTRSNFSLTAAAYGEKPYSVVDPNGLVRKVFA